MIPQILTIPGDRPDYAAAIMQTVRHPLLVLDGELCVKTASGAFYRDFGVAPETTIGRQVYELGNGQWDIPSLRKFLEEILPNNNTFEDYRVEHDLPRHRPAHDDAQRPAAARQRQVADRSQALRRELKRQRRSWSRV